MTQDKFDWKDTSVVGLYFILVGAINGWLDVSFPHLPDGFTIASGYQLGVLNISPALVGSITILGYTAATNDVDYTRKTRMWIIGTGLLGIAHVFFGLIQPVNAAVQASPWLGGALMIAQVGLLVAIGYLG